MKKVWLATAMVAVLIGPVLAFTEKATVLFPVPLVPDVIPIQLLWLLAVQAQPLPAVTEKLPLPAEAPKFCEVGVIE